MDHYLTPAETGKGMVKSKGSKFLGFLFPTESETESGALLKKMRKDKTFRGACHFCHAGVFGIEQRSVKSSDDGEPTGTAGKPILHQLEKARLTQCMLVVVRFFGGVELGTGGLIQSYRETAVTTIENTPLLEKEIFISYRVETPANELHRLEKIYREHQVIVKDTRFAGNIRQTIYIKPSLSARFEISIQELFHLGISVKKST